jgi:hypothetical protein
MVISSVRFILVLQIGPSRIPGNCYFGTGIVLAKGRTGERASSKL